jgi:hypothetical protein
MIQIQLQPEMEAQLAAEARARGITLDRYIETIVSARPAENAGSRTIAEAIEAIRAMRKDSSLGGPEIKELIHEGHKY